MKLRIYLFSLIFIFLSSSLSAQIDEFTQENFLEELEEFLGTSLKKDEMKNVFDTLSVNWTSGKIDEGYQYGIALTASMLKKKRAKKHTHFYHYLRTINGFVASNKMDDYMAWEVALVGLINVQNVSMTKIGKYLEFSALLVVDNILTQSSATTWFTEEKSFLIENNIITEELDVSFENLDLACASKKDTFYIFDTKGVYYPSEKKWIGEGGRVTWKRAGLDPNNVYADIQGKYELVLKGGKITIDSVLFTNTYYNQTEILGQLNNDLMIVTKQTNRKAKKDTFFIKNPSYPRFTSYKKDISLTNIFPQVDYFGGFSMKGYKFIGEGTEEEPAKITFKKKNQPFIETKSLRYTILDDEIKSSSTNIVIKLNDKNTITHNKIKLNYFTHPTNQNIVKTKADSAKAKMRISMYADIYEWKIKMDTTNGDTTFYKVGLADAQRANNTSFLTLTRSVDKVSNIPFVDNYHNMNIYCSQLIWKQADSLIYIYTSQATRDKVAKFESIDYFTMAKFQEFDETGVNHLIAIQRMTLSHENDLKHAVDSRTFTPDDYTYFLNYHYKKNYRVESIKILLGRVADAGFIEYKYNGHGMIATVNQKLYDFVLYRTKYHTIERGKDFDNIEIISKLEEPKYGMNAKMNLKNLDLKIYKSKPVWLSRGKKVAFESEQITVRQNRNMNFAGDVYAGDANFHGDDFTFNYETFDIEINKDANMRVIVNAFVRDSITGSKTIDRLKMFSQDNVLGDTIWLTRKRHVESIIEDIKGKISIDDPKNRSGMYPKKEYPKFKSTDTAHVDYDKTINDRYDSKKFYFQNYGIEIDSMTNITEEDIKIEGKFFSNIFPVITEELNLGADGVLGLTTDTAGIVLHDGKYYGEVILNKKGLTGEGRLEYLTTNATSDKFTFYPDYIVGITTNFDAKKLETKDIPTVNAAKGEFMRAQADTLDYKWIFKHPANSTDWIDYVEVSNIKIKMPNYKIPINTSPFKIYSGTLTTGKASFNGTLHFAPEGVEAKGTMIFLDAEIKSESIQCEASQFRAPDSNFYLKENNNVAEKHAFEVLDINTFVDIEIQQGVFTSNTDSAKITFPTNKFACYIDHFVWDIGEGLLNIGGGGIPGMSDDLFATTKKGKDSLINLGHANARLRGTTLKSYKKFPNSTKDENLSFDASSAIYNIDSTLITAKNVDYIEVADAVIYPTTSVKINPNAVIDTLYEVKIETNNHNFFNAEATIIGRNTYTGKGTAFYAFNEQEIKYHQITVENDITEAIAKLQLSDTILLNDYFVFKGINGNEDVTLYGNKEELLFNGKAKIIHSCQTINSKTFSFESFINPDSVYIPIGSEIKNGTSTSAPQLYAGFYMGGGTNKENDPYGTFVTPLHKTTDNLMLKTKGFMYYDIKSGRYEIGSKEKIHNPDTLGNLISLNPGLCFVYGEGELEFNVDFGEVKHKVVGTGINNPNSGVSFNTMIAFDFFFANSLLKKMEVEISKPLVSNLEYIEKEKPKYQQKLKMFYGKEREKESYKICQKLIDGTLEGIPKELKKHTLMFADVTFKWDSTRNSFISDGKLGLSNLAENPINGYIDGVIEMRMGESGVDELLIFLNPYKGIWYYFRVYARPGEDKTTMNVLSSDDNFMEVLNGMKPKEKKDGKFHFENGDDDVRRRWLKTINYKEL